MSEHCLDQMLGFGTRYQYRWSDDEIHAPEFLVAGDVLGRYAAFALSQSLLVSALFVRGESALGMGIEIVPGPFEGEHEQDFGIQARRSYVGRGEAGDSGSQGGAEDHLFI